MMIFNNLKLQNLRQVFEQAPLHMMTTHKTLRCVGSFRYLRVLEKEHNSSSSDFQEYSLLFVNG